MEQPIAPAAGKPPPGAPPAEPMAPEEQGAIGEMQQASPEEQKVYEHFIAKAYELIYDKKTLPKIIDMLGGEGDPMEGLARTAAMVIQRVMDLAGSAGEKLAGDVVLHAGTEVFEDLANLSKVAKIKDFSADHDALEGAYFRALDIFRQNLQKSGGIDKEAAVKDFDRLIEMDKAGKLEELFRGLAEKDEAAAGPAAGKPVPAGPRGGLMEGMQ